MVNFRRLGKAERQFPVNSRLHEVRLGDGCRHVFLDVGSNAGLHLRFLMEGHSVFPRSRYLLRGHFQEYFGPSYASDPTICAFAFEPNPVHYVKLQHLSTRLRAKGRRVEVIHAAVSNQSGSITFYHRVTDKRLAGGATGFGASPEDRRWDKAFMETARYTKEMLPTVDLAAFIATEIVGRRIPAVPVEHAKGLRPPAIVMKLDCEGAELVVLERMLHLCVLCAINFINLEYHPTRLYPEDGVAQPNSYAAHRAVFDLIARGARDSVDRGHPPLGLGKEHQHWKLSPLYKVMEERRLMRKSSPGTPSDSEAAHCRTRCGQNSSTRFSLFDDESYPLTPDLKGGSWEAEDSTPSTGGIAKEGPHSR